MDAHNFLFCFILSNYVWSILFYQNKDRKIRVCIKICINIF